MRITMEETAKFLLENDKFLLLCHNSPDGDTVGSATALYYALKSKGKKVQVKCGDKFTKDFDFMFAEYENEDFEPEHVVSIDVADTKLLGDEFRAAYGDNIELCIDHHYSNIDYAQKLYLESDSASTAEIIYLLIELMGIEITPLMASCLYTGVSTDTGCFRFSNTKVRTFEIAAKLAQKGADTYNIAQVFFETKTKTYAALERMALKTMRFYFDDRCAVITITQRMYKRSGSDETETTKLASLPRQIEGVQVGVLMKELKDGKWKISLRTHGDIDAGAIAGRLGGGGHAGAAACVIDDSRQNATNNLLREIGIEIGA